MYRCVCGSSLCGHLYAARDAQKVDFVEQRAILVDLFNDFILRYGRNNRARGGGASSKRSLFVFGKVKPSNVLEPGGAILLVLVEVVRRAIVDRVRHFIYGNGARADTLDNRFSLFEVGIFLVKLAEFLFDSVEVCFCVGFQYAAQFYLAAADFCHSLNKFFHSDLLLF